MKKTIDYETWVARTDDPERGTRVILNSFDLARLKRDRSAPARARTRRASTATALEPVPQREV